MPEPVLIAIAAALAGRAAGTLYDLVKRKFSGDRTATETLAAAEDATNDSPQIRQLATILEHAEHDDPAFSRELRAEWERVLIAQHATSGGVNNQVSGNVSGKVVQAREIHGNVNL